MTKSPFSKKRRKSIPRGPVLGPKTAENRRRGEPKSQKSAKKSIFLTICFFNVFFNAKKIEKNRKTGEILTSVVGTAVCRRPAGRKGRVNLPGTANMEWFRTTPLPRWGTANLNRCARSPYPRGTPQSGLLRLGADPGNIPAEPDKPRQHAEPRHSKQQFFAGEVP